MSSRPEYAFRVIGRLLWLAAELSLAAVDYALRCGLCSSSSLEPARAQWLQRTSRRLLKIFKVELNVFGPLPTSGFLVCNHLSYLDILVLSALSPSIFVAKSEVKDWPIFGWFARLAGTIFVDRTRRSRTMQSADNIHAALQKEALVVLFPEGTSSGGDAILPFKSSLLAPATNGEHPITAAHLHYTLPDGNVSEEVCYWKDMTLVPHLLNLFGKRGVGATASFTPVRQASPDRKELARLLHSEVVRLSHVRFSERRVVQLATDRRAAGIAAFNVT